MAIYPWTFDDYKICIHCGSHSVKPIDKFNRECNNMIYPVVKFKCKDCGREYYIKWVKNRQGETVPTCCGEDEVEELSKKIISFSKQQRRNLDYEK